MWKLCRLTKGLKGLKVKVVVKFFDIKMPILYHIKFIEVFSAV